MSTDYNESGDDVYEVVAEPSWMTHEQSVVYHKHRAEEIRNRPFLAGRQLSTARGTAAYLAYIADQVSNIQPLQERQDGNLFTLRILRAASNGCSCAACLAADANQEVSN